VTILLFARKKGEKKGTRSNSMLPENSAPGLKSKKKERDPRPERSLRREVAAKTKGTLVFRAEKKAREETSTREGNSDPEGWGRRLVCALREKGKLRQGTNHN